MLAADTIVHTDEEIFGKPVDDSDAAATLRSLSGRWHRVTSAWCLSRGGAASVHHTTTRVRFRALSEAEIERR